MFRSSLLDDVDGLEGRDVGGQIIYVKLLLREDCVVVSFHEDEGGGHEEDE